MNGKKKVLVLGATGAMGSYLVPELSKMGYEVHGTSRNEVKSDLPGVTFLQGNAKDVSFLAPLLEEGRYDAVVDFMIYQTNCLAGYLPRLLANTDQYVYISSYRVYDDLEVPVKETSPRLLDSGRDVVLCNSDDYSIYKARGENIIRASGRKNWTIVRPAITYGFLRYQLATLEAPYTVGRALRGKPVLLPETARGVEATMSWGGDVAKMIARLLFNEKALGEAFTAATSEHHTWGEIADYYKDICDLKSCWIDQEDYIRLITPDPFALPVRWQLEYDRLFTRIMDNSKILAATGMEQSGMMPLYEGLRYEVGRCPKDFYADNETQSRFDAYAARHGL